MWNHLKRVIKKNGAIVMTAAQPFTTKLISSNYEMFKYCWYWKKSQSVGHLNAYKMPMKNIEDVCIFYKELPTYNPILMDNPLHNRRPETKERGKSSCYGAHSKSSNRKIPVNKTLPSQVVKINNTQENQHPTQKPVELMEYFVSTYTNEGQTVLDFTMGSGTTGVAACNLNRSFIGIELDPEYFKIAQKRIISAEAQISF